MATTLKQIEANRRNAAKSTGPRTADGKAASRSNAMKHGVLSSVVVAENEDRDAFDTLCQGLFSEFQPQTMVEIALVEKLAVLFWRGRRLVETERRIIDAKRENIEYDDLKKFVIAGKGQHQLASLKSLSLNDHLLVGRYETMISNQIFRTLQTLNGMQDRRTKTIDAVVEIQEDKSG
jgi:hypothetical protein